MATRKKMDRGGKKAATRSSASKASASSASATVDEQLAKYRSMRDFATTAEPAGGHGKTKQEDRLPFVIQKHAATRLHYDFRLAWRGVLKSWAVAKGPSYVVADKRLAVQVEDHPMEYGGFEGTIPKGQYGGGTVLLWDEGTWEPVGDADEMLRTGRLKFILHGHKLKGHWTLVRMGGKAARESKPNWLLIKEHDEFERTPDDPSITEESPDSVVTGRDLDAIAAAKDHVWDSRTGLAADARKAAVKKATPKEARLPAMDLRSYPKEGTPGFIEPQLASSSPTPPAGDDWVHELKLDGYRIQAHLDKGKVQLLSRNGLDWTARMKDVAAAVAALNGVSAVIDGEVVVLDENGLSSFGKLQTAFDEKKSARLTYFCFDLLHLDTGEGGRNLRSAKLLERKELLERLLQSTDTDVLRFSEHLQADGHQMFHEACKLGAEGIVSKQADAKYVPGRSSSWTKTKCILKQELVIGGFTLPSKGGDGLGSLLLGYYDRDVLRYAGRAGTGFTQKSGQALRKKLEALQQKSVPFAEVSALARKGAIWVKPQLVGEVEFRAWTEDGMLRQAAYKGLREDKAANQVRREHANPDDASVGKSAMPEAVKKRAAVRLTHADKVIDAASGLTKQTLADYYDAIAEKILPHIQDRPLSIVRCPDGSTGKCFFQKHVKAGLPKGTGFVDVPDKKTGKIEQYITISTKESLVGMAQINVLEMHPWGARNERLEEPDRLILDLDPDESLPWDVLAESAAEVRQRLKKLGLESFLKGTGGKGLHIIAPIAPEKEHGWGTIKAFAHAFVQQMELENPKRYLTKMTKAARSGRIYLDYLRNERGATAVAPYSPRSRAGVNVSMPLSWNALKAERMPRFSVADFAQWIGTVRQDPWKAMLSLHQPLGPAALEEMGVASR